MKRDKERWRILGENCSKMCKMDVFIFLAIGLLVFQNVMADDPPDDGTMCLENCLADFQQRAPRLDASVVLSIGHIRSGNQTVMCPKYDAQIMNTTCGPYRDAATCLSKCPDSQLKTLSTSGFAPLQLVCIDSGDDFERFMPCLSETCPSVESACQPKCGSFDDLSRDMLQLLRQIRGGDTTDQQNARIDPNNVTTIIAKACGSIECYAECSRGPTTEKCGQDAYNLEMEVIWTIFSSMTQSMSSIGLSTPWPDSCQRLQSFSTSVGADKITAPPPQEEEEQNVTRSNSVDQFIQKDQNQTRKCDGNACGLAPKSIISTVTLLLCIFVSMIPK